MTRYTTPVGDRAKIPRGSYYYVKKWRAKHPHYSRDMMRKYRARDRQLAELNSALV